MAEQMGSLVSILLEALLFMSADQIKEHEQYIKEKVLALYKIFYETSNSALAQIFRTTICYLDEVLNLEQ